MTKDTKDTNRVVFARPTAGVLNASLADAIAQAITITHTIVDRRAGSTMVERVFGETPNLNIVAHYMKQVDVRAKVAKFFLEHQVVDVIEANIPANTISVGEAQATVDGLLRSLGGKIEDGNVLNVVSEFVIALAYKSGLVNESTITTRSLYFTAKPVTITDLSLDLAAQSAVHTAETISVKMDVSGKMSKRSYARAFSEALQQIGYELHRAVLVQHVLDDMVKAIRVKLLGSKDVSMVGEVDTRWLSHPAIDELIHNYTFVSAAIAMPIGAGVTPVNDFYTLEKEAPIALASLKGSKRYAVLGADEYLKTFGKKTIVDVEGSPVYFVGYRNASLASVAQCVSAFKDAVMPKTALNIVPGPDAITKFIGTSMPRAEAASLGFHVNELIVALSHLAETGDPRAFYAGEGGNSYSKNVGEAFILGDDGLGFTREMAALLAERCHLRVTDDSENGVGWVYVTHTKYNRYADMQWGMCYLPGGEFVTDDIGLFLLVCDDLAPKAEVEPRSQLLSDKALFTRVLDLDSKSRTVSKERVPFNVKVAGDNISGSITTNEVGMLELPEEARFVVPVHNKLVMEAIAAVHESFDSLTSSAQKVAVTPFGGDGDVDSVNVAITVQLVSYLELVRARAILKFAQSVPVQYRQMVSAVMRMRAMAGKTAQQVLRLRGAMQQQTFAAYADVVALETILATNGLEFDFIQDMLKEESLLQAIMLQGSDRKQTTH